MPAIETIVNLRPQVIQFSKLASQNSPSVNLENRTVTLVASDETPVIRFDWENWEPYELVLSHQPGHVDLTRVNTGVAMFFDGHPGWLGGTRLGKLKEAKLEGGRLTVRVKLNRSAEGDRYLQDVEDGTEPGNSVGVIVRKLEVVSEAEYVEEGRRKVLSKPAVMRAVDWELEELSAVDIPANPNAGSKFSISSHEREQLSKLPVFPVRLSGDPGYLKPVNVEECQPMDKELEQKLSSELKEANTQLEKLSRELEDLRSGREVLETERRYFELRAEALEALALTNRMTEDEFNATFEDDSEAYLKKLSKMSSEDRRVELKFLSRSIERYTARSPMERVQREEDRAKLSKSKVESRGVEGNPAEQQRKAETPTGESVEEYAQRLSGNLGVVRV